MSLRHPGKNALRRWLAGEEELDVDSHVETCERCASLMEELEASENSSIVSALTEALSPPTDLTERLVAGVSASLSSREVIGVIADMFGAGLETTRMLIIEEHNDDN